MTRGMLMMVVAGAMFFTRATCRQMCLSCQYVDNPKKEGIECSTDPRNWTFGDTRMRCNFRCTTDAHFDKKTGDPTYFYRGCSTSNDVKEDGCYEDELREYCSFNCVDIDYCNDRAFRTAPSKESELGLSSRNTVCLWLELLNIALVWWWCSSLVRTGM